MRDQAREMKARYAAQSLVGGASHLTGDLALVADGALSMCLLRTAQELGLSGENLDLVQALLSYRTRAAAEGGLDPETPLSFEIHVDDLSTLTGWTRARAADALEAWAARAGVELPIERTGRPDGAGYRVDLSPLLERGVDATGASVRRMLSLHHFRELNASWIERVLQLDRLLMPPSSGRCAELEELVGPLWCRWETMACRDLQALVDLFDRPWTNSEEIYAGFAELVEFDDLAWPVTSTLGLRSPLSRVLYEQAGMRAQVRRDRAFGYTTEPLN